VSYELNNRQTINDVELAWDSWGAGSRPALVLCHGFSGSAHDFALHIEDLAGDRRVIALDHRGHGRSGRPADPADYSLTQLTDDLIAFVGEVAGGPIDLLGHSMGGQLAMRMTLARPDLVHSLILMDTSGWSFLPPDPEIAALVQAFIDGFDPAGGLPDQGLPSPEEALVAATTPEEWQRRKEELSAAFDPNALKALGLELFDEGRVSVRSRLGGITCPTTVIVGSEDHPLCDQAADLADAVHGTVVVIDGAFHSPQLTHPVPWRAAVEGHLRGT
jgi:pimeloyl-ACP methyl ester carboxylesterase